jgi:UDP-glucose:(heptosyl)LPS alpha-1,3-glucosyltransferase
MRFSFCIFKYSYPYRGLERDFTRIIEVCQQRGHEVDVFTMHWQGIVPKNLNVIIVPGRGFTNHGRAASFVENLANMLNTEDYDAVIGFQRMPGLDVYYAADICFAQAARQQHSWLYRLTRRHKIYSSFERAIFSPASKTHIMYLAEQVKQGYIEYYQTQEQRFHLLTPGIVRDRMAPENAAVARQQIRKTYQLTDEQRLVLQIGSDFKCKSVGRALLAIAALPNDLRRNTVLWIVGKGKEWTYKRQAKNLGIAGNVRFLGPSDKVPELLLAADLLLHPAYREAAGMVIVEAIVAGLPVLTTAACGFAYHVDKANAGLVVPLPFEQENLNKFLHNMLVSEKLSEWRKNGIAYGRTEDLYSRDKAVEIIEMVVKS